MKWLTRPSTSPLRAMASPTAWAALFLFSALDPSGAFAARLAMPDEAPVAAQATGRGVPGSEVPASEVPGSEVTTRLLREAGRALTDGDLATAEDRFRRLLQAAPDHPLGYLGLSDVYEQQGKLLEALPLARKARQLDRELPAAALATGRILARLRNVPEALEALAEARRLAPDNPQGHLFAALLLRDVGREAEAAEILQAARRHGLKDPDIDEQLGFLKLSGGDPAAALEIADDALGGPSESAGLYLLRGLALAGLPERREEAVTPLRQALELGSRRSEQIHLELGALLLDLGRGDEALPHLEEAARQLPNIPEAHYRLAAARRAAGDTEGAREALERFQQLGRQRDTEDRRSKEAGTALNEVQRLAVANRLTEALAALDALRAEGPTDARHLTLRAKILFSMGRRQEAFQDLTAARQLRPESVEIHFLEGQFQIQLGRLAEAETALRRAVALKDDLAEAWELLGALAGKDNRPQEAVDRFQKALDQGRDSPGLRLGYAAALETLGRQAESEAQMEAYRRLSEAAP